MFQHQKLGVFDYWRMIKLKDCVPVMNLRMFTGYIGYNAHTVPKLHISIKRNHDMIKMPTKRGQMLLWLTALFFLTDCSSPLHSVHLKLHQKHASEACRKKASGFLEHFPHLKSLMEILELIQL